MVQKYSTMDPSDIMADIREKRANTKALHDSATLTIMDTIFGIRRPPILANNFEINLAIIQMVQAN